MNPNKTALDHMDQISQTSEEEFEPIVVEHVKPLKARKILGESRKEADSLFSRLDA